MSLFESSLIPRYDRYVSRPGIDPNAQCRTFESYIDLLALANLISDFHRELEKVPKLIEAINALAPGLENKVASLLPFIPLYDYPLTDERLKQHQKIHNHAVDCYQLLEYPDNPLDPLLKRG